jgi:type II secretory pathway component PulM
VAHSELTRVQQMKQKLARMQILAAQKTRLPAPDADIAALIEQASLKAHLPVSPPAQQGNQLEFRYPGALRFSDFANWLQTLELRYGIVTQEVQLTGKGQGTVEVKRLVLSRGSRS